ncbi:hypothetical protein SRABI106_03409 [Rahnella aquatilis]|nr:hypothetical protein SRABI106_03409 [Rahnella aquatilis]
MHVELGRCHKSIVTAHDVISRYAGADMHGGEILHVVHHARFNHGFRAARAFLGRLENQLDGAAELVAHLHQHVCQPEANGGVTVVTTGMHHAVIGRSKPVAERAMLVFLYFV